ncbi:MAG: SurA N-terminal domain-containing protein [Nitrospirota bacterium]
MKKILFIMVFSIASVVSLALPWESQSCSAYVLDKVEAVVNDHVITMSDVDQAVQVEKSEGSEAGKDESALRKAALDSLINRALLIDEARKFNLAQVTPEEVEKAFMKVKSRYPDEKAFEEALQKEEITPDELKDNLRDQLLVIKYVDRRIKAFVLVTPDEERKYYDEHKKDFGDKDFAEAEPEIKRLLTERDTDRKLGEYLRDLKSKADIIINP